MFSIISNNVNAAFNLAGIIDIIKSQNFDILLLQEVIQNTEELSILVNRHNYKAYCSLIGDERPGVGIIFKSNIICEEMLALQPGRILYARFREFSIINIYANSGNPGRLERNIMFSETLPRNLKPRNILPIIMGDFNCIINACDTTENYVQKQCIPLKDLVNLFKYKDSFNHVNPGIQEYTYHRRGVAPSRLDRAYIPEHLVGELEEAYHQATLSDHRAIVVKLNRIYSPPIQRKESPYWKLNVSILNHRDFIPGFVNVWGKLLTQEISFPSADIWWETLVKPELKRFLIQFSSMRSKERRSQKSFLFAGLDQELASGNFNEVNNIRVKLKV